MSDVAKQTSWKDTCFKWLLVGVVIWTAFVFGEGMYISHVVRTDVDGAQTLKLLGGVGAPFATDDQFISAWHNPEFRAGFVASFLASMWQTRFEYWFGVTVVLLLFAMLVKPKAKGSQTAILPGQ